MRYLALLYGEEVEAIDPTSPAFADEVARYDRFDEMAGDAVVGGEALEPTTAGITIQHGPDGPIVTDGVFSEANEVIGGFYVLETDGLDAAVELAKHIPPAEDGAIELRPLVEWFEEDRPLPGGSRRYLALLTGTEDEASHPGTPGWDAGVEAHAGFGREAGDAILGGGALHPSESGTVVQLRGGEVLLTDGTYAEAAEVVGGLYLLWAPSRDAVVEVATRIPMGSTGAVQLRPIVEFDE